MGKWVRCTTKASGFEADDFLAAAAAAEEKRGGTVLIASGEETGVEMDAATFGRLPDIRSRMRCPVCSRDHDWSTREAWLGNPAPSAPALPWLFINNLSAAND